MTDAPIKPLLILSIYAPSEHNRLWYDLQRRFIKKTTTVDYDFKIFLNGIAEDGFNSGDVGWTSTTNNGHPAAMALLLEYARQNPYRDYLFLDSDCFPVRKDWNTVLTAQMERMNKTIAAPVRVENLDLFPHPCAVFIDGREIHNKTIDFRDDGAIANMLGDEVTDVGTAMFGMDTILPLLRTNAVNVHPVAAAIYHHLFYHHGAGSRVFNFRITNRYRYHDHWYKETARDSHAATLLRALKKNPVGFINRLLGKKEKLLRNFLNN